MMGHREKLRGGSEYDFLTRARRYYAKRAGKIRWWKRNFSKRVRRDAKEEALREARDA